MTYYYYLIPRVGLIIDFIDEKNESWKPYYQKVVELESGWGLGSKLKHLHFTRLPSFEKSYNILSLITTNIVDCVYR